MLKLLPILLLAGCGGSEVARNSVTYAPEISSIGLLRTEREFREQVVGIALRADQTLLNIAPDGSFVGIYGQHPFAGSWEFRKGLFCQSATPDVDAPDRQCFRIAVHGREVWTVPVSE